MTLHTPDPDTARWNTMRDLSNCARLLARAEENRPDDRHETSAADLFGAAAIVALLFAAGVVIREGWLIWSAL